MRKIRLTTLEAMSMMPWVLWLLCGACSAVTPNGLEGNQLNVILDTTKFEGMTNFGASLLHHPSGLLFLGAKGAILSVDTNRLDKPPRYVTWDVPEKTRQECILKGKSAKACHNYIRLLEFLGDGRIYVCGTYAFDPKCVFLHMSNFTLEKTGSQVKTEQGKGKCPFEPDQSFAAVMAGGSLYTAVATNFMGTEFRISRATSDQPDQFVRTEDDTKWLSDPEFVGSAFIQEPADNPTGEDDKLYFFFTELAKEYKFYTEVRVPRVARVCRSDLGGKWTLQKRWTTFLKAELVCEDKLSKTRYNILTDVFAIEHVAGDPSSTHFYGLFTSQWEPDLSAVCVFSVSDVIKVMSGPFKGDQPTNPNSRPGQCLNNAIKAEGTTSSLEVRDEVLTFVRNHPLMEKTVTAASLLVRKGTRYVKMAVARTEVEPKGVILHLGTDRGALHQMKVVGQRVTLLQEIPLFTSHERVNNIMLHKGQALVVSPLSLARVQKACRSMGALGNCVKQEQCSPSTKKLHVTLGLRLLLPCLQLSARSCSWDHPYHSDTQQHHSDLEVRVTEESQGLYKCRCLEVGPDGTNPTHCLREIFDLILIDSNAGSPYTVVYCILCLIGGIVIGGCMYAFIQWYRVSKYCLPSS